MEDFNNILFKTAILSMAIDGEIQPEELNFFNKFSEDNIYFEDFNIKEYYNKVLESIKNDSEAFITSLTEEVNESKLNKQFKLIILDVIIAIIQSDNKIDESEVFLLNKMLDIFNLNKTYLLSRYPELNEAFAKNSSFELKNNLLQEIS